MVVRHRVPVRYFRRRYGVSPSDLRAQGTDKPDKTPAS
jgi:hypothetical protein